MYNAHRGSDLETVSLSRSPLQDTWSSTRVTHCAITTSILVMYVTPHESEQYILDQKRLLRLKWPGNHLLSPLTKKPWITFVRPTFRQHPSISSPQRQSTSSAKCLLGSVTGHNLGNLRSGVIFFFDFLFFWLLCFFASRGKKITPDTFI